MISHSLLAAALALVAADAPKDDSKKDLEKLQGAWTISTITFDGGEVPGRHRFQAALRGQGRRAGPSRGKAE